MSNKKHNPKNQTQLITESCIFKPLSMSSLEISELTGKRHDNVIRDIKIIICELNQLDIDSSDLRNQLKQYVTDIKYDDRGYISVIELDEELTLTLTSGYSIIQRNRIIKQWQTMRKALDTLRYKKHDLSHQVEAMATIYKFLPPEYKTKSHPYINANRLANKVTAILFGATQKLTKDIMTIPMLERRQIILEDYISLLKVGFSYEKIKSIIHEKYLQNKYLGKGVI